MQTALNFQGLSIARVVKVLKEMERTVKVGFDYTVGPRHMTTPLIRPPRYYDQRPPLDVPNCFIRPFINVLSHAPFRYQILMCRI